uniref:Nondiscriminating glutamyl-tRNA synthetase EARS2, mitochondrial n=1 Tax=Hucho hucho TaxID=62062 RepID=A0A4W5LQR8_9TELE
TVMKNQNKNDLPSMSKPVRVRFAPSPTGPLHIGGVRTALFNYLFAKKNGGTFYLRIEDTDQNRFVPGAEEYIMEALEWLGIAPEETVGKNEKFGPYRQSERKHLYRQYADQLIESGNAYYAFDTAESLDAHRKQHEAEGKTFIYNHHNREKLDTSLVISKEETEKRIANNEDYVIRFKTPVNETLHLQDIIRGEVQFQTGLLDDKVLFKSDGMPTYHLANIVDDHLMETTHVIRGEEWLPSMPLHVMLYRAFGWDAPEFAHLPLILKPIGNGKLSKQGWNDGTEKELFSLDELTAAFDLKRVHKSGAKFDPEKNKWFNHQYLIKQKDELLAKAFAPILIEKGIDISKFDLNRIVSLVKDRAHFVTEFWEMSDFFFVAPTIYDEKARKNWKEETPTLMQELISVIEEITDFTSMNIETIVK